MKSETKVLCDSEVKLISIIRRIINSETDSLCLDVKDCDCFLDVATKQGMGHFVGYAIENGNLIVAEEQEKAFQQQYYMSIYRVINQERLLNCLRESFEQNGIMYILLKGAVLRKMYPCNWMRVSADIDILIRAEDKKTARKALVKELGCIAGNRSGRHETFISPDGIHIEVHFHLHYSGEYGKESLGKVWEHSSFRSESSYEKVMSDEYFYLYHIVHAVDHFQKGGFGIRTILDTWILNHCISFDRNRRQQLLCENGLLAFSNTIEKIAEKWFSGVESSDTTDVEEYILNGGIFGSSQRIIANQVSSPNTNHYLLNRLFPRYRIMRYAYPVLCKNPLLLPFCWIHRLVKAAIKGKTSMAIREMMHSNQDEEKTRMIESVFKKLDLK